MMRALGPLSTERMGASSGAGRADRSILLSAAPLNPPDLHMCGWKANR